MMWLIYNKFMIFVPLVVLLVGGDDISLLRSSSRNIPLLRS